MKVLKGFFLVLMVICLIVLVVLTQVHITLQNTVLSSDYFEDAYDKSDMSEVVTETIKTQINELTAKITKEESSSTDISELIDTDWLESEIKKVFIGFYAFVADDETKLPSFDIEEVTEMVMEITLDQIMSSSMVKDNLAIMGVMLESYDALVGLGLEMDEAAIAELAIGEGGEAINTEMVTYILETSPTMDDSLSTEDKVEQLARGFMKDQLNFDELEDELDFNILFDEIFSEDNPLVAAKNIISSLKTTLFYALLTLFLLFVLIVIFTAFTPASIFGWLSAPIIAGGLFGFTSGLLGIVTPFVARTTANFSFEGFGESNQNIADFVLVYARGISSFMMIQGAILLLIGVVFIVLAVLLSRSAARKHSGKPKNTWMIVVRVIIVILLFVAIFFCTSVFFINIYDEINESVEILDRAQSHLEGDAIIDALSKTINLTIPDLSGLK